VVAARASARVAAHQPDRALVVARIADGPLLKVAVAVAIAVTVAVAVAIAVAITVAVAVAVTVAVAVAVTARASARAAALAAAAFVVGVTPARREQEEASDEKGEGTHTARVA
jgi:hypothetical protein